MSRRSLFWGGVLVVVGLLILLDNLGVFVGINVWGLLFPIALIILGIWVIWGNFFSSKETEQISVPLNGATQSNIRLQHGAGRLYLSSGAPVSTLMEGDFAGGAYVSKNLQGDRLDIRVTTRMQFIPFIWTRGSSLDWDVRLNDAIPISLDLETGASEARLDLSELKVNKINLKCGASSTKLNLPANAGQTLVSIEAGAASVEIQIPTNVAARIHSRGGLSQLSLDKQRFPRSGDVYQSLDYDTAENKADIDVQMGVGSVAIY